MAKKVDEKMSRIRYANAVVAYQNGPNVALSDRFTGMRYWRKDRAKAGQIYGKYGRVTGP